MSFNTGLDRKGPGLLVRDILKGEDEDIGAVLAEIAAVSPDIAVLQGIDFDHNGVVLDVLADALRDHGLDLPHHFMRRPNTGTGTGFDLDKNGRLGEARDAQGYGTFSGQGGIGILSRFPILEDTVGDYSDVLWKDVPGPSLPVIDGKPYFSAEVLDVLRLHTVGAWVVPIQTPDGPVQIWASQAGPPVFDGPENRNGLRNAAEIRFWTDMAEAGSVPFVIAAGLNADPHDGDGSHAAISTLLASPNLQDPRPASDGAQQAADAGHVTPPSQDTVDWPNSDTRPGNLRVDYVLPSTDLRVVDAGVHWPPDVPPETFGSRHRAVWVDVALD
ncbi:endonuclease/exonuclease/phosphatase family protein [Litoreibacter roseus]|uniref:Endonuclease/exonuclease/phosphatase domain-containing protein n=1 Tax=Litoreibacter roseus TaxID=2601869 RepID=A0A6N6JE75_9RHOB|nr:endonuclease/exonuclease/phosphatase family protein [Litoreibacter roseus]GFE64651.1 hypothetical protein KIN_17250 [Litoreibacter roseus]